MFNNKCIVSTAILGLASLMLATNASAAVSGVYLGGQVGAGNIHQDVAGSDSNYNLAGRLFAGYQFNQYFAAEMGATKFSNATGNETVLTPFGGFTVNEKIETYVVDLAAKGILPLQNGFSLYGKLGGAYVNEKATAWVSGFDSASDTEHKILPEVGAGVSYDINPNLVADLSWTHIQKTGNTDIQNLDFVGLGLSYHFA